MSKIDEIRAYPIKEFLAVAGFSKTTFWKLVKQKKLAVLRVYGRVLIPHSEAVRFMSKGTL